MKRVGVAALVLLLAAVALIAGIGALLPQGHTASGRIALPVPPDRVFAVLSDVTRYPEWRSNVSRVEVLGDVPVRWREHDGSDAITFEVVDSAAPGARRVRIADPDLPFGGTWTYSVVPDGTGSRLEIVEDGEVYNPVFRFISRFVIGHTATIDTFLADLRRHFQR